MIIGFVGLSYLSLKIFILCHLVRVELFNQYIISELIRILLNCVLPAHQLRQQQRHRDHGQQYHPHDIRALHLVCI